MSDDDFFPAAEKILSDIYQVFIKDPKLTCFGILTKFQSGNKSPVRFSPLDHVLGLESWCIPYVYSHAYETLMKIRGSKRRIIDPEQCDFLLVGALLIIPEVTTFWNMRKELISSGKLDPYFDLHFTSVVLSTKPKCQDVFLYRKWLLQKIMHGSVDTKLIESEIEVCEVAADRYSNNYHAWTHRIWCLSHPLPNLLEKEWASTFRWVQRHVSDYSGFHYRQKVLSFVLDYIHSPSYDPEVIKFIIFGVDEATESFFRNLKNLELTMQKIPLSLKIFIYELDLDADLISTFIGHETLWSHRRYIFHEIKKVLHESSSLDRPWGYFETRNHSTAEGIPAEKTQKIDVGSICDQFSLTLSHYEETFLNKSSDPNEPRQRLYAMKHKEWLSKFCNFHLPHNIA